MTIEGIRAGLGEDGIVVNLGDGRPDVPIPSVWLRDHCPCRHCRHPHTRQRIYNGLGAETDVQPTTVSADTTSLSVLWSDGHRSVYPHSLFSLMTDSPSVPHSRGWLADELDADALRPHTHDAVVDDDAALRACLQGIERHGFCFVTEVPPSTEATGDVARRIGYIRNSVFGGLWTFTDDLAHEDTAYTREALDLHTDGTYCHDAPGLQILHCLELCGAGARAESLLVDGRRAANRLRERDPAAFDLLGRVEIPGQYFEPGVHLRTSRPVLRLDADGEVVQVSFNNADRAPLWLGPDRTRRMYAALRAFYRLLHEPRAILRFVLEPGTLLIFDNWRVLHGRGPYTGTRRMCGCYLNREDFHSRLRVLRSCRTR